MELRTFKYSVKIMPMVLAIAFGLGIAAVLGNTALTNDRGMILNGLITFSQTGASIFYWLLAMVGVAMVVIGILALIKGRNRDLKVVLTDRSITAPKSAVSSKIIEIPYRDVTNLSVHKVARQEYLMIKGKADKLVIYNSALENKADFADLLQELQRRCA